MKDFCSNVLPEISGISKGTVHGPLFFVIFLNDTAELYKDIVFKLFTDDIKPFQVTNAVQT